MYRLFENPPIDMSMKYAMTMNPLLVAIFYLPIFPFVSLIGFLGSIFSYWIDKYLLLRRYKYPDNFGP